MAHERLNTVAEVFDALGGVSAVAALTGRSVQAVCNWRERGRLAPVTFLTITAELSKFSKIANPSLWSMEPERAETRCLANSEQTCA